MNFIRKHNAPGLLSVEKRFKGPLIVILYFYSEMDDSYSSINSSSRQIKTYEERGGHIY